MRIPSKSIHALLAVIACHRECSLALRQQQRPIRDFIGADKAGLAVHNSSLIDNLHALTLPSIKDLRSAGKAGLAIHLPSLIERLLRYRHTFGDVAAVKNASAALLCCLVFCACGLFLDALLPSQGVSSSLAIGILLAFMGAVSHSMQQISYFYNSSRGFLLTEALLMRNVIVALLAVVKLRYQRQTIVHKKNVTLLAMRSLCGFASLSCTWYGATVLPLTQVVTLYATLPLWTLIFAKVTAIDETHWTTLLGIVSSFIGMILILQPWFLWEVASKNGTTTVATLMTLLGAIFAGIAATLQRMIREDVPTVVVVFWGGACGVFLSSIAMFVEYSRSQQKESFAKLVNTDTCALIALFSRLLIGVSAFLAISFYNAGLRFAPAGHVTNVFQCTELLLQWFAGVYFFNEELTALGVIGAAIIILSGVAMCMVSSTDLKLPRCSLPSTV